MAQNRRAAKTAQKPASSLKKFYGILIALAVVGVIAIAWLVVRSKANRAASQPVAVQGAEDPEKLVEQAKGVAIGPDTAPAKMLVFSDFQCPYCASFATQIEPLLNDEFVKDGTLQFVYYDFPLGGAHRYSFLASRAARCAGDQDKFWEYQKMLFGRQSDWSFDQSEPVGKFLDYGTELGLDANAFEQCVKSDKYQDVVSANRLLGERLGVGSTPTIFINGRKVPAEMGLDIKGLREMIHSAAGTPAS